MYRLATSYGNGSFIEPSGTILALLLSVIVYESSIESNQASLSASLSNFTAFSYSLSHSTLTMWMRVSGVHRV